jgi:GDPmannose 4,6-dehydratase
MSKKALITGITGQDGAFLAKQLLDKGYEVYGTVRRGSDQNFRRLKYLNIYDRVKYVPFEITEFANILLVLKDIKPNYIYNLAAQSFVQESFINPIYTSQVNYIGVLNLLEAIRLTGQDIKFYQASTSEMFGDVKAIPQNENTPFMPLSPYGVSKVAAHYLINNYREAYNIFFLQEFYLIMNLN